MIRNSILILLLLLGYISIYAQSLPVKSKYSSASNLIENNSVNITWSKNSAYYLWSENGEKFLYRIDLNNGKKAAIVTERALKDLLLNGKFDSQDIIDKWNLYSYSIDDAQRYVSFRVNGHNYTYYIKNKSLDRTVEESKSKIVSKKYNAGEHWKKYNADSSKYIFGRGYQLYLFDNYTNKEYKLTSDGQFHFSYNYNNSATVDTNKSVSTSAVWVGDKVIAWREDKRHIDEMAVINSLNNPKPTLRTYKFPMPGDSTVVGVDVKIWNTKDLSLKTVKMLENKDQRVIQPGQLVNGRTQLFADRIGSNSKYTFFLRRTRSNEKVELCRLDYDIGEVKVIISDTTLPHINEQLFTVNVFNDDKDILFWSERSGYGQYYHYNFEGKLLNKVGPKGEYVVSKIVDVDTNKRELIFEVYGYSKGINPYYKQYLRTYLDNELGFLLTPEFSDNQINISSDRKYLLNTYSTITNPNKYTIRNLKGKLVAEIGEANISKLESIGWKAPELLQLKATDDSTFLYGLLYKPADFDSHKKYPLITSVYPGPQDDFVPQSFTIDDNYHQSFADLGFLVLQVPSRGSSPYRGLKFHSYSYGNMRDYPLADNKNAIEYLAKSRSYIDLNKIGIFGHSGGGFMTATAMMTYPEFYKVGVAASGNYDPNIYTQWWGETYHGLNTTNKPNYIPTAIELAPNLKGKLLLITGDVDTNVHPAHTFRLANALIKANKFFDMMVLPGKDHGLGDWYYQSLIANYFLLHLK
ncbi:S9 family peptidase [Sphingobacterium composti Ten et al. 2007 non Yoo et al. 2007]|uniref:S9 family peptidase n=1 Tax=Sphingobacterium composti TaxID=363260 RepID=UPI001357392A|nr:prolyl oligopeptidase family serine peptidase [Sphingobacterium composti Ten et al. 2007 non Yoo et al. 2007]